MSSRSILFASFTALAWDNLYLLSDYHSLIDVCICFPSAEGQELKDALKKQLEFYFSKQNLANDHYLISQVNNMGLLTVQ